MGVLIGMRTFARLLVLTAAAAVMVSCDQVRPVSRKVLLKASFDSDEGYVADRPLVGQLGWKHGFWSELYGFAGHGVEGNFAGMPKHAFIGGMAGDKHPGVHVGLHHTMLSSPAHGMEDSVEITWEQTITDSTKGGRNYFEWVMYGKGEILCGLCFDNGSENIWRRRYDNGMESAGVTFTRGETTKVTVRMDFKKNEWEATVGSQRIPPKPMAKDRAKLGPLEKVAPVWWSVPSQAPVRGGPVAGDNRMVFDNLEISAWPAP
jgi:hypothetical protein